jgi:hypothetical protein
LCQIASPTNPAKPSTSSNISSQGGTIAFQPKTLVLQPARHDTSSNNREAILFRVSFQPGAFVMIIPEMVPGA